MEPKPKYDVGQGLLAARARAAWEMEKDKRAEVERARAEMTRAGFVEWFEMEPDGCEGWVAWSGGVVLEWRRQRYKGVRMLAEGWYVLCPRCGERIGGRVCRSLAAVGERLGQAERHRCQQGEDVG